MALCLRRDLVMVLLFYGIQQHFSQRNYQCQLLKHGACMHLVSVGFGFDSKANDYKAVRLLINTKGQLVTAEVYSGNKICWGAMKVEIYFCQQ